TSSGQYFHVNTADQGTVPGVTAGPPPPGGGGGTTSMPYTYDGYANFAQSCTPDSSGDASGPWSATAVYPNAASVPAQLCVILYDMHGKEGQPSGASSDYSTTADNDNSIQTNAFNPAVGGGYCFTPHFVSNVTVVKSGPATGNPNGTGTYQMVATNSGTAAASDVVITDTLPAGETFSSASNPYGTCSDVGQVVSCPVGTLAANDGSAAISVTVGYGADTAGQTLTDCATVTGGTGQSCVNTVISQQQSLAANIYLCVNGQATTIEVPGGTLSSTGPSGSGPSGASDFPATHVTDPGTWTVSATAPSGYTFISCSGGADTPSLSGNPATNATEAVNVPAGGSGQATFYVLAPANFNVNLTKAVSDGQVTAGQGFTYTLMASNTGGAAANGVVVTDAVPGQLVISGTPSTTQGSCSTSGNNVTCNLGTLPANGGSATITINVTTSTTSCGVVNNTGQVTASGGTTGNSNTVSTTVACPNPGITVGVVKTNNAQDPNGTDFGKTETAQTLGESFSYQAVITNTSTVTEVIGTITDSIAGQPLEDVCAALVGQTLAPNASVTCTFPGVAPSTSGASETDTVTVPVTQQGNPSNTGTGTDTSTVNTPPAVTITKANNAAGTGYGTSETAAAGSTSVPYQVVVTNPNSSPGTITSLTDLLNGTTTNVCPDLIGTVLQPGASVTCNFTGPVPTTPTTDTAGVTLSVNGTLVSGTAQSTVFPPVLGTVITPTPPTPATLAFTGAPIGKMLAMALGAIAAGLLLLAGLQLADERRRSSLRFVTAGRTTRPVDPETLAGTVSRATGVAGGMYQTPAAAAISWAGDRVRAGYHRLSRGRRGDGPGSAEGSGHYRS
ncbi:MAG: hypothetical protein ACRDYE_07370, partial [Acidimicrobiales bacterium]